MTDEEQPLEAGHGLAEAAPVGAGETDRSSPSVDAETTDWRARALAAEEELESARAAHQRMVNIVSHDLRSPIVVIAGYAQLLGRRLAQGGDDRTERQLFAIGRATDRLKMMLDELLAYSRVGSRAAPHAPVDLDEALGRALRHVPIGPHEMTTSPLGVAFGDEALITDALTRLIDNAIKFTDEASARVSVHREDLGAMAKIVVRDHGIGMDPGALPRAMELYGTLHPEGTYGGVGAGLAVVARIVEHHGGELGAWPAEGGGCAVWFTLPRGPEGR